MCFTLINVYGLSIIARMKNVTLRQLEIFESVARHRSFTRAAELLHLTQPSVSIQVKSLSEAIGHKLFHKIGRNVQLSDVGRELYDTCRDFSALWLRISRNVTADSAPS